MSAIVENHTDPSELLKKIQAERVPRHIAMIMDGNGRWAKQRGLSRIEGHRKGAETVRRMTRACRKLGVEVLTLYAFSDENWQRPATEVAQLMELLAKYLLQERQELKDNAIALRVIGHMEKLPKPVQKLLFDTIGETAGSSAQGAKMTLNLALSYGARNEILRAVQKLIVKVRKDELRPEEIDMDTFSACLDTASQPDPDLLVRTSGEMRISNFLLWQLAYTEIHFTPVLWPDFSEADLYQAILEFQSRERRFGLTAEQIQAAAE